jgi:hypothetical protein
VFYAWVCALALFWATQVRRTAGLPCRPLEFLNEARRYGLVERGTMAHSFTHRLFQEHFAAAHHASTACRHDGTEAPMSVD